MRFLVPPRRILRSLLVACLLLGAGACVDRATEHRIRANALFKSGDFAGAVEECNQGLASKPDDASLLVLKGKADFELGHLSEAAVSYQEAIDKGKGRTGVFLGEAYLGLAVVASRKQDWTTARARFLDLLALNPNDATSHANLAKVDLALGKVDEAVQHAEEAARSRGNEEGVLFTLGNVYLAAGRGPDAEKTFEHICQVVPQAASCPYGLALVLAQKGDRPGALAKLKEAVDKKMPNPEQMADDPALASLKDDPEFRALAKAAH